MRSHCGEQAHNPCSDDACESGRYSPLPPAGGVHHASKERRSRRRTCSNDVVEFARGRLPEPTFNVIEPFLRHYYDLVDVEDLQSRDPSPICTAPRMAHWQTAQTLRAGPRSAARLQPDSRAARLALGSHGRRDRQRRHAVSRRFGDDGGQPPRPRAAFGDSSGVSRLARARRRDRADRAQGARRSGATRARTRHRSFTSKWTAAARRRSSTSCAMNIARVLRRRARGGRGLAEDRRTSRARRSKT